MPDYWHSLRGGKIDHSRPASKHAAGPHPTPMFGGMATSDPLLNAVAATKPDSVVPDWGTSCGGQRRRRDDHKPRLETVSLVVPLRGVWGHWCLVGLTANQ